MNENDIPDEVYQAANAEIEACLDNFPEDEWITLIQGYELNLWTTSVGVRFGTLYKLKTNGDIDTMNFVRIFEQTPKDIIITMDYAEAEHRFAASLCGAKERK